MTAIGFDLPPKRAASADGDAAAVLGALNRHLAQQDVTSDKLFCITFHLAEARVEVAMRESPHDPDYPDLADILGAIARTCAEEDIAASRLVRIAFLEEVVVLALTVGSGEVEFYMYAIVLG